MNLPSVSVGQMGELFGFFGLTWFSIMPATHLLFGILLASWLIIKIRKRMGMDEEDVLKEKLRQIRALKKK